MTVQSNRPIVFLDCLVRTVQTAIKYKNTYLTEMRSWGRFSYLSEIPCSTFVRLKLILPIRFVFAACYNIPLKYVGCKLK